MVYWPANTDSSVFAIALSSLTMLNVIKNTCLNLEQRARIFYNDLFKDHNEYLSAFILSFKQPNE